MEQPNERHEVHGQYVYGALVDGTTYAILSPAEQKVCQAAARVIELLEGKSGVMPGKAEVGAEDYYDLGKPHGKAMQRSIINTLARLDEVNDGQDLIHERHIHGEFMAQAEALHVIAVADGSTPAKDAGKYGIGAHMATQNPEVMQEMQLQAAGEHYRLPHAIRAEIENDIKSHHTTAEDISHLQAITERDGGPRFIDIGPVTDLNFNEKVGAERARGIIEHNQSSGNPDLDDAMRAVHKQTVGLFSPMRQAHPEHGVEVYDKMHQQSLQAAARLLALGKGMHAREAARFMLNDMAIMHTATREGAAGYLHLQRLTPDDQKLMADGEYGKMSDDAKISVHSRLMNQHYVAPGLFQGASKAIEASETMPGPLSKGYEANKQAFAAQQQGQGW